MIRRQLTAALADHGAYADLSANLELFPAERLSLRIVCRPASEDGLPPDVVPEDPLRVLGVLRSALAAFTAEGPAAASLASSKAALLSVLDTSVTDPAFLTEAAMMRYSAGKDMVTGYKSKVGAVTPASVKEVLSALDSGSKVEYVVY